MGGWGGGDESLPISIWSSRARPAPNLSNAFCSVLNILPPILISASGGFVLVMARVPARARETGEVEDTFDLSAGRPIPRVFDVIAVAT